jgi:hypothetical protein
MILVGMSDEQRRDLSVRRAYHRFVKTTPKPRATKKSSGELVGPPPLLSLLSLPGGLVGLGWLEKTEVVDMVRREGI